VAGALMDARLVLLKDKDHGRYAHPYYWAPFLVFGDWR
jgi:CHAT domain-containing protein